MKYVKSLILIAFLQSCSHSRSELNNCEMKIDSLKQEMVKLRDRGLEQAELAKFEAEKFRRIRRQLENDGLWEQYKE